MEGLIAPLMFLGLGLGMVFVPVDALVIWLFFRPAPSPALRLAVKTTAFATPVGWAVCIGLATVLRGVPPLSGLGLLSFPVARLVAQIGFLGWQLPDAPRHVVAKAAVIMSIAGVFAVVIGGHLFALPDLGMAREKAGRSWCSGNLKMIGLALNMYADDNQDAYPPYLYKLAKGGYLTVPKCYVCPSTKAAAKEDIAKPEDLICNYVYRPVPQRDPQTAATTPIAWDEPTNHKDFGNVLFADGHVKGYAGAKWLENTKLSASVSAGGRAGP